MDYYRLIKKIAERENNARAKALHDRSEVLPLAEKDMDVSYILKVNPECMYFALICGVWFPVHDLEWYYIHDVRKVI